MAQMSVLVVGGGGREHALCLGLDRSESIGEIHCAPGNAGTAEIATNHAFSEVGVELTWTGSGVDERGVVEAVADSTLFPLSVGTPVVFSDKEYCRLTEVPSLLGDARKAERLLGWHQNIGFVEMVQEMVCEDLKSAAAEALLQQHGHQGRP